MVESMVENDSPSVAPSVLGQRYASPIQSDRLGSAFARSWAPAASVCRLPRYLIGFGDILIEPFQLKYEVGYKAQNPVEFLDDRGRRACVTSISAACGSLQVLKNDIATGLHHAMKLPLKLGYLIASKGHIAVVREYDCGDPPVTRTCVRIEPAARTAIALSHVDLARRAPLRAEQDVRAFSLDPGCID